MNDFRRKSLYISCAFYTQIKFVYKFLFDEPEYDENIDEDNAPYFNIASFNSLLSFPMLLVL